MSLQFKSKESDKLWELAFFGLVLAVLNAPLLGGGFCAEMIFRPDAVERGEWWRVAAHPFVHLSWWHLLLDAGAFLLLYEGLQERSALKRIGYVVVCAMGSLLVVSLTSPSVRSLGFCGLSGAAHGLMAVSALESVRKGSLDGKWDPVGVISLCVVAVKSAVEVIHGHVLFDFLHFGMVGSPIPASHAGGALAGIVAFLLFGVLFSGTPKLDAGGGKLRSALQAAGACEKRVVALDRTGWSRQE